MKDCSTFTVCNLLLIAVSLPWGSFGDGDVDVISRRNVRRRTRYISNFANLRVNVIPKNLLFDKDEEYMTLRGISFSMPDAPTVAPAKPPTREDRDLLIQDKCGITAIERSRDILTELLTVSDSQNLISPETSQFKARDWLDNMDPAIVCPQNRDRIDQRYRLALLYFELGGSSWTRCRAEQDIKVSDTEEECPGARFLDKANECDWGRLNCGDNYNDATAGWLDAYYPLEVLNLQSNNLVGKLFHEFYGFQNLREIFLNNNRLSGAIKNEIGNFKNVTVLQLESNSFEGDVPEEGLFEMKQLAGLSIQGNKLEGSLEKLCDARDDRRVQFESYLALMVEADCLEEPQKVICSCCTCF